MKVTTQRRFGPYHIDDMELDWMKREIQDRLECELEADPYIAAAKFVGVQRASESDCEEWNRDLGGDPVHSPEFTAELVYEVEEIA